MYNSLSEVILLTEELLKDAQEQHASGSGVSASSTDLGVCAMWGRAGSAFIPEVLSSDLTALLLDAGGSAAPGTVAAIVMPPQLNLPSILPASVAEQIRRAQIKAAILGQADAAWAIGAKCQAVYSADGQFYNAIVEAVTLVRA